MMTLKEYLTTWRSDDLKKYVDLLPYKTKVTRKAQRIDFICEVMLTPEKLRLVWEKLDTIAQKAVSLAYHRDGIYNEDAFFAQYQAVPPRPEGKQSWWYFHMEPILFDLFVIDGHIPTDLMPLLEPLALPLDPFTITGQEIAPVAVKKEGFEWELTVVPTELAGRTDLLTYLQLVEQQALKFSKSSYRLTAASVRKLYTHLMRGDFRPEPESLLGRNVIRPFGLDVFVQESGLMTRTGKLTKAGRTYLQTQDPEIFLEAFEKWAENGKFDELSRITGLSGQKSKATSLTPPTTRRQPILEALSWCPVNKWVHIGEFYRAMIIWGFDFDIERGGHTNLYIGSRSYGELNSSNYWIAVNGLYVNALIWEYLATIGAIDIAFTKDKDVSFIPLTYDSLGGKPLSLYDGLLYFRINPWGAFLLGQADEYQPTQPQESKKIRIDEQKRIHLLAELLPSEKIQLEAIATKKDNKTYSLDNTMILTAVENGQTIQQLITFLEAIHDGGLPSSVTQWLNQLKNNLKAMEMVGTAVIIQIKQTQLKNILSQDTKLSKLYQQIDDTTIIVKENQLTRFHKLLKEKGYLLNSS